MNIKYFKPSKTKTEGKRILSTSILLCILFFCSIAHADILGPGWFYIKADPISPDEAAVYFKEQRQIESQSSTPGAVPLFTVRIDDQITELARALQYDPKLIFDFVHNYIVYKTYYGAHKGSTLTLLDGSGNDCDQAALLIALLRASGYTADFVHGRMWFPDTAFDQLANWIGVDIDPNLIIGILNSSGIPTVWYTDINQIVLNRVWVRLTIEGTNYFLDPAFKSYSSTTGINLSQALGYNRNDLLVAASTGTTITADSVQNMNESSLNVQLEGYTANLASAIENQYPNKSVTEIIGGRSINYEYLAQLPETLPFTVSDEIYWSDDVPTEYTAKLRIQHQGIDHTFEVPDITGKRLSLTYTGSSNNPELRLDGAIIATGNATTAGTKYDLTLSIDHPYPNNNGTYGDQAHTFSVESGRTYAVLSDFGGTTDEILKYRQNFLDEYLEDGLSDTSEQVLGETLNIMGLTWMKETLLTDRLLQEMAGTVTTRHHTLGLMAQEAGYYVDIPLAATSVYSRQDIDADMKAHFYSSSLMFSGFEHGMLEQLMGSDNPGASTIKLLQIANSSSMKIFQADSNNYGTIRPQLINYSSGQLDQFQSLINNGDILTLPENGQITLNEWRGITYLDRYESGYSRSLGLIIGGDYYGGYGGNTGTTNPTTVSTTVTTTKYAAPTPATVNLQTPTTPVRRSIEPVDLASGAYLYDSTDLYLSGGSSLAFHRSYASNRTQDSGLGKGWAHNYDISLKEGSNGDPGLGSRSPADMAAMLTAIYVNMDLIKNEDTLKGWMTAVLTDKWAIDQLIDNVVTVYMGGKAMQFVLQPDGSYTSPPGITAKLVKEGSIYRLEDRFDTVLVFNSDNLAEYQEDADGNRINFSYTGDNLTSISNSFGQSFTLSYTGDRINSVNDSTGRSVSYGYTGDNLTSYTDANGKLWQYGYDSSGMTTLTNPLSITTATNTYDTLKRVKTQTVPRQSGGDVTYNFYFSGYRNAEEDPEGHQLIYYFDEQGRSIADENQLGHTISRKYDGQNHIVETADNRGFISTIEYTGHDRTKIIDPLNNETAMVYDAQHRMTETADPLNHRTDFDYDTEHHLISSTVYPASGQSISTSATYFPNGQTETTTDGRNITTALTYDTHGNPAASRLIGDTPVTTVFNSAGQMTSLTDRENSTTSFTYNDLGLVETKTDPFGRLTSYTYYDDGKIHTVTDRNNDTTTYTYTPTGKGGRGKLPGWFQRTIHLRPARPAQQYG